MPTRQHNKCRICIYPRLLGLPLGVFILSVVILVFILIAALAWESWTIAFLGLFYLFAIYVLNVLFAGNFGWSKKRMRHTDVKTGLFMAKLDREIKLRRYENENKNVV